jgi:hypothetical protein
MALMKSLKLTEFLVDIALSSKIESTWRSHLVLAGLKAMTVLHHRQHRAAIPSCALLFFFSVPRS